MSSINVQFSVAVHMLAGLAKNGFVTSEELAASVNANSIFIKRVLAKLSRAGLVTTTRGKRGGCNLARKTSNITLFEIYQAVDAPSVFAIHSYPAVKSCIVSVGIKQIMNEVLENSQNAVETDLKKITLEKIVAQIK